MLGPQFEHQLSFKGLPRTRVERGELPDPGVRSPDVVARIDRQTLNRETWETKRLRIEDDNAQMYRDFEHEEADLGEESASAPLGEPGNITTEEIGLKRWGVRSPVPDAARFVKTAKKSWRTAQGPGGYREIPVSGLHTLQHDVSSRGVARIMAGGDVSSPRLPYRERPRVWFDDKSQTHTLIDGNHRASAAVLNNEMFLPAWVASNKDLPKMQKDADQLRRHRRNAAANVDEDFVWERMKRNWRDETD